MLAGDQNPEERTARAHAVNEGVGRSRKLVAGRLFPDADKRHFLR
jgi:hypothetical protein